MKKNNNCNNPNGQKLAEQYLGLRPFSKNALTEQLLFDGCGDGRKIVENLMVDWDAQCEQMAVYLLEHQECQEKELEEILLLEGFPEETVHEVVSRRNRENT